MGKKRKSRPEGPEEKNKKKKEVGWGVQFGRKNGKENNADREKQQQREGR